MIIATKKCERLGLTITNDFFSQAQLEGFTLSFLLSTDNVTRSFALLLLYCLLLCYIVLLPHKVSPLCFTWPLSGACPFWGAFLVTGCFVYFIHLVSCSSSLSSSFPFFFVHLQLLQTATKAQSNKTPGHLASHQLPLLNIFCISKRFYHHSRIQLSQSSHGRIKFKNHSQ